MKSSFELIKNQQTALCSVAPLVGGHPMDQKIEGSIPSQGTYPSCRFDPGQGTYEKATSWCFSLFPPSSLSKKSNEKNVFWWG